MQLQRGLPHREGRCEPVGGRCRPAHPEPGQQRRRQPDALGPGPAGGAAGDVRALAGGHGDQPGQLPGHRPGAVEVAVGPADQPGHPGGPEEAVVRAEHLAGPERQPAADLDAAPHAQTGRGVQGRARGDGLGQVAAHRLRQPVQLGRAEPAGPGGPQQPGLQVGGGGPVHGPSIRPRPPGCRPRGGSRPGRRRSDDSPRKPVDGINTLDNCQSGRLACTPRTSRNVGGAECGRTGARAVGAGGGERPARSGRRRSWRRRPPRPAC